MNNLNEHISTEERDYWNSKANGTHGHNASEITGLPTSLPANGGNSDTVDNMHANEFAPAHHIHNVTQITGLPTSLPADGGNADTVDGKHASEFAPSVHTHDDRYYTETEVDTRLNGKSNTDHDHDSRYYTESEVDSKLASKSNSDHNHDSRYYTESEVDNKLSGKSDTSHTHDNRYYTETEMNTKLAQKSDVGHTHQDIMDSIAELETNGGASGTVANGSIYHGSSAIIPFVPDLVIVTCPNANNTGAAISGETEWVKVDKTMICRPGFAGMTFNLSDADLTISYGGMSSSSNYTFYYSAFRWSPDESVEIVKESITEAALFDLIKSKSSGSDFTFDKSTRVISTSVTGTWSMVERSLSIGPIQFAKYGDTLTINASISASNDYPDGSIKVFHRDMGNKISEKNLSASYYHNQTITLDLKKYTGDVYITFQVDTGVIDPQEATNFSGSLMIKVS